MFGAIAKMVLRGGSKTIRAIAKQPIVKTVAKSTGIGAVAYGVGNTLFPTGGGSGNLPAFPAGNLPLPGTVPGMGQRSIFRDDPNVPANIEQFAIPERELRVYYRAPKGFVVMTDPNGQRFGVPKTIAREYGWRPAKKPPISVGDWQAVKRADRTTKKMKNIFKTTTRVENNIKGGKVCVTKPKRKSC